MFLLKTEDYGKVSLPLQQVTINNLFARAVVEERISGKIYVDNLQTPTSFYIVHPYGMSLLFGNPYNERFNTVFRDYALNVHQQRDRHEWMQVYPESWNAILNNMFEDRLIRYADNTRNLTKGIVELNTRVNFIFNRRTYYQLRNEIDYSKYNLVSTHRREFETMKGTVVPSLFWENVDDFLNNGIGFSLYENQQLATTAYSAFIHGNKLELGIETNPEFRGKYYAMYTCARLIDYCLEHGMEPVWACRLENKGSYKLALKLGFEPVKHIPFYRLSC